MTVTESKPHHPYSPSTLQNREACPCYESRQTEHVRAIAGTLAHRVVETGNDERELGDDDAIAAAACEDFVEQRRQLLLEARDRAVAKLMIDQPARLKQKAEADIPGIVQMKETYLPIDDIEYSDCKSTTGGYADHILIDHTRTEAEGFDYKFGFWAVEKAENNLQGIAYSLGLFKLIPSLRRVRFWFFQPHLDLITSALFERSQIPALYLRVQTVVARAMSARQAGDFSAARPAVPVCNFCANLGKCPAVLEFACHVGAKFSPLQIPSDITPTKVLDPHNTLLALNLAQVLKIWSEAFRKQVSERVIRRDADMPAGYDMESRSNREIADATKYRECALKFLTEAEYESTLEQTFGSVEKLIQDKAPRGNKKAAVEEFQQLLVESGAVRKKPPYTFLKIRNSLTNTKEQNTNGS